MFLFVLQLILLLFRQVGTTTSMAATTTAITAVIVAMQVSAGNVKPTRSILTTNYEENRFIVAGILDLKYTEYEFLTTHQRSGKGCLYVHIYEYSGRLLSSKKFSIDGRLYYSISFKGFYSETYSIRITFHKNIFLCHGHKWKSIDVLLDGDYYMIFDERIYTASYPANVILKNVALTRYTTGKCGEDTWTTCDCPRQCQRDVSTSGNYYCSRHPTCSYLETPQWVCASNGQTYRSECEINARSACSHGRVYLVKRGKCDQNLTATKVTKNHEYEGQGHLTIILCVVCPLIAVIIVLLFICQRCISRKEMFNELWRNVNPSSASSYRRFREENPTPTLSSAQSNKIDNKFFVTDPVKYEQPESERAITTNVVYLEKDDYNSAGDVTMELLE